jgi:hypothetical protein
MCDDTRARHRPGFEPMTHRSAVQLFTSTPPQQVSHNLDDNYQEYVVIISAINTDAQMYVPHYIIYII